LEQRELTERTRYQLGSVDISIQVGYQVSLIKQGIELKETKDRASTKRLIISRRD